MSGKLISKTYSAHLELGSYRGLISSRLCRFETGVWDMRMAKVVQAVEEQSPLLVQVRIVFDFPGVLVAKQLD